LWVGCGLTLSTDKSENPFRAVGVSGETPHPSLAFFLQKAQKTDNSDFSVREATPRTKGLAHFFAVKLQKT
jgi:hypothetical protein